MKIAPSTMASAEKDFGKATTKALCEWGKSAVAYEEARAASQKAEKVHDAKALAVIVTAFAEGATPQEVVERMQWARDTHGTSNSGVAAKDRTPRMHAYGRMSNAISDFRRTARACGLDQDKGTNVLSGSRTSAKALAKAAKNAKTFHDFRKVGLVGKSGETSQGSQETPAVVNADGMPEAYATAVATTVATQDLVLDLPGIAKADVRQSFAVVLQAIAKAAPEADDSEA